MEAEQLMKWFKGREDVFAQSWAGGSWAPVRRPISVTNLEQHLSGRYCCGFYLMREDNTVNCACIDIDNHNGVNPQWMEQVKKVADYIGDMATFELSQSGEGCHIWFFWKEPVPAWWARKRLGEYIEDIEGPTPEIYPKQDTLSEEGLGNLVRYPYWNRSMFYQYGTWEEIDFDPMYNEGPTDEELAQASHGDVIAPPKEPTHNFVKHVAENQPESILARRWRGDPSGLADQSRSAMALSLCCELVWYRIPTDEITASLREWCREHSYDKGEREDWISHTVEKAYLLFRDREDLRPRSLTVKDAVLRYLKAGTPIYYQSGIKALDESIGGVSPGELLLLAARPSNCKSALGVQWAHETARRHGPTLILSAEMSYHEIGRRAALPLSTQSILAEQEATDRYDKIHPIYLEDDCPSVESVIKLLEQHVRHHGVKMAFVDYAQLLQTKEGGSRYEKVTHISQALKAAAKTYDVALVVAAQMSREVEKRAQAGEDWDPTGSDLKESGQLEQDADKVLFLIWPTQMYRDVDENLYNIKVFKNRNGEIKRRFISCAFYPETQTFI